MLVRRTHLAFPVLALLAGATPAMGQSVITPAPVQPESVIIAPSAPPPPRVETIPAPPTAPQAMYWQPGHWMWDGANWRWTQGQYVVRPSSQAIWEPGHWMQRPSGGYVWVDGHWGG